MADDKAVIPAGSEFDRAEQSVLVHDDDRETGLDTAGLRPLAESTRAALDHAALADVIDQAWITPLYHDDDADDRLLPR